MVGTTVIVKIAAFFYKLPLGSMKLLGDEGFAHFMVAYNIYSFFLTLATAGFPVALSRMISEADTLDRPAQVQRIFRTAAGTLAAIGGFFTLMMLLFNRQLAVMMGNADAAPSILALAPAVVIVCLTSAYRGYCQGRGNMIPTAFGQVIEEVGKLVVGLTLAFLLIRAHKPLPLASAGAIFGVTAGAVGADLANLVNEAALRAVRQGRKAVNQQDLLVSFEVVIAGTEKKGTVLTDMEKRIVSYHEVGHALVAALQKHTQPVSKITIVPHTSGALGYTMQTPEEEKFLSSREELLVELQTLLGGRAAEQIVFGIATTGASNDIERATDLARKMVTQYGMSEKFGLMALSTVSNQYLDGSTMMNCADETAFAADSEIQKLLESCYEKAKQILREHRELLDEVALYLLQKETITGDELMTYVNAEGKRLDAPASEEAAASDVPASAEDPFDPPAQNA